MVRKQLQYLPYSGSFNGSSTVATAGAPSANKQWRSVWFRTTVANVGYMTLTSDAAVNLRLFVNNGFASIFTSSENATNVFVADGKWHHFVCYHEIVGAARGAIKLWVDGVLRFTGTSAAGNNSSYNTVIGNDSGGTYFNGNITWVAEGSGVPTDLEVWNMFHKNQYPSHTTAMWKFPEGTGTTSADSVGSNTLTLSNFTWSRQVPHHMGSRRVVRNLPALGNSLGENIVSTNNTGITGAGAFTMGGWCRFGDPTGAFQMYTNFGASAAAQSWYLGCSDTNMLTAGLFSNQRITSIPIPRNRWIHYVCSWDGTTLRIYVNGKLVDASTSGSAGAYAPNITNGVFKIARAISGTAYNFAGVYSETFLANAALSENEIRRIFTSSVFPSSAIIVYRFHERGGTSIADSSGNANTGTLTAETTWSQFGLENHRLAARDMRGSVSGFNGGALTHINCGNDASLQITTGTVLAWFKAQGLKGAAGALYNTIFAKDTNYASYEYLGQLIAYDWTATANRATRYYTPNTGWHLAAYVFESGVANGSWATLDAGPILTRFLMTTLANTSAFAIGNQTSGSNGLRGYVGEVVVCSTKLTQAQIYNYYTRGILPSSVISRWRMNEGTGTSVADSVGSNTGTLSGSPTPVWYPDTPLANRL